MSQYMDWSLKIRLVLNACCLWCIYARDSCGKVHDAFIKIHIDTCFLVKKGWTTWLLRLVMIENCVMFPFSARWENSPLLQLTKALLRLWVYRLTLIQQTQREEHIMTCREILFKPRFYVTYCTRRVTSGVYLCIFKNKMAVFSVV